MSSGGHCAFWTARRGSRELGGRARATGSRRPVQRDRRLVIRGAVYRVDLGEARRGHEQRGRRYGLILSPTDMAWSVAPIVPTFSTQAQPGRLPARDRAGRSSHRFLVDQLAASTCGSSMARPPTSSTLGDPTTHELSIVFQRTGCIHMEGCHGRRGVGPPPEGTTRDPNPRPRPRRRTRAPRRRAGRRPGVRRRHRHRLGAARRPRRDRRRLRQRPEAAPNFPPGTLTDPMQRAGRQLRPRDLPGRREPVGHPARGRGQRRRGAGRRERHRSSPTSTRDGKPTLNAVRQRRLRRSRPARRGSPSATWPRRRRSTCGPTARR